VSERIRRPVALFVVSVLVVALSAGAAWAANVNGTSGNDIIGPGPFNGVSLDKADLIRALQGNDTVDGFTGNDTIEGGEGEDNLIGAKDSDTVDGGNGKDIIDLAQFDTGGSHDEGLGGNSNDTVKAKDGNHDVIDCGNGKDTVFYDQGIDSITKCEVLNP
jgi:hypothetical protein